MFLTDFLQGQTSRPSGFFADRIRDLKFVRNNLDEILNGVSAYSAQDTKVGIAGHSFGAITTLLAAGTVLDMGGEFGGTGETVDLELEGLAREFSPTEDPDDDYGAFVPADAYMVISGKPDAAGNELVLIDPDRPNMTGRDFVQAPLMTLAMQHDPATTGEIYFNAVSGAFGINDHSAYGAGITGANHITPISHFMQWNSWSLPVQLYDLVLGAQDSTPTLRSILSGNEEEIEDVLESIFLPEAVKEEEESRTERIRELSLMFWDAHLSPNFDQAEAIADLENEDARDTDDDVEDYSYAPPTHALVVRDGDGAVAAQLQDDGNILLLKVGDSGITLNAGTIAENAAKSEFIVRDASGDIKLLIDEDGAFKLKAASYTAGTDSMDRTSSNEFVVRRGNENAIVLDASGSLRLRGYLYTQDASN